MTDEEEKGEGEEGEEETGEEGTLDMMDAEGEQE